MYEKNQNFRSYWRMNMGGAETLLMNIFKNIDRKKMK